KDVDTVLMGCMGEHWKSLPSFIRENREQVRKESTKLLDRLRSELIEVKDEKVLMELMDQYIALQTNERKRAFTQAFKNGPYKSPPFILTGQGYVSFWPNLSQLGTAAVMQEGENITIYVRHPINSDVHRVNYYLDDRLGLTNKVDGKLAGFVWTVHQDHEKQLVVIDPSRVGLRTDVRTEDGYIIVKTPAGVYSCQFADENRVVSIKRKK
ncbi:MAG: hypothetical protein Q8L34_07065, partial [Candidatus Woesearchaeota archaeon]|nr:hypothetical protein [Candidatus Woesearchaeota archaeon]